MDNNNIVSAMQKDETRENEHTFYDVFEKYSEEYIMDYKLKAGIPFTSPDTF